MEIVLLKEVYVMGILQDTCDILVSGLQIAEKCISDLEESEVALAMDFAETYANRYQDETQCSNFDQNQITVHPMMAYYKAGGDLVKHAIIGITDEEKKDAAAVKAFEDAALQILAEETIVEKIHEDGCASQYKRKHSFYDISIRSQPVIRNYFQTSYSKSVCDCIGAVVKNSCFPTVLRGKTTIGNSGDMHNYCNTYLAHRPKMVNRNGVKSISKTQFVFVRMT